MNFKLVTLLTITLFSAFLHGQNTLPDWAKGIVWYQIFPERFANGNTTNNPTAEKVFKNDSFIPRDWNVSRWTGNWFEQAEWEKNLGGKFRDNIFHRRYGGDIQGIIDRLDYLKELGVGAIYLNPVFDAVSMHKYDGSTFHHIDFNFGPDPKADQQLVENEIPDNHLSWVWTKADSLFLKLIDEVHNRGMKIIIDGVFNHTGIQFWAFQDILKKGEKSKYKDWYIVHSFDDSTTKQNEFDYKGWWGTKFLPEFNRTEKDLHPGPKQYIFHSTLKWMDPNNDGDPSDGIDGWRLDVAREVPLGFWNDWRKLVKSINPNALIVGELWELSPDFISENGVFDALMNYNFAFAVNDFFIADKNQIDVSEFAEKLNEIDLAYPPEYLDVLQNLVDSHDTDRLLSMIVNPDRKYDRDADERNPNYSPAKPNDEAYKIQKLLAVLQMTYRGAPMIYYGDEVGMWGADDPHDRKPMIWDNLVYDDELITEKSGFKKGLGRYEVKQNKELLDFYQKVIRLRNNNLALQKGSLNFLYTNDEKKSFVFERKLDNNGFVVAFNLGDETDRISLHLEKQEISYEEIMSGEKGTVKSKDNPRLKFELEILPKTALVYKIYSHK